MTDAEHFGVVLHELWQLLLAMADLRHHVVLIGGQVIALESMAAGEDGVIRVETNTGVRIDRGFSMEPDLLIDIDAAGPGAEVLGDALRTRSFVRVRDFRWKKEVEGVHVQIDLFMPADADPANAPMGMTALPGSELVLARTCPITVATRSGSLEIAVPDPAGFIATKIEARKLRDDPKDAFDMYAYVSFQGDSAVRDAIGSTKVPDDLLDPLRELFDRIDAPGVLDVLAHAASLSEYDKELLARHVVDLFRAVFGEPAPSVPSGCRDR